MRLKNVIYSLGVALALIDRPEARQSPNTLKLRFQTKTA